MFKHGRPTKNGTKTKPINNVDSYLKRSNKLCQLTHQYNKYFVDIPFYQEKKIKPTGPFMFNILHLNMCTRKIYRSNRKVSTPPIHTNAHPYTNRNT